VPPEADRMKYRNGSFALQLDFQLSLAKKQEIGRREKDELSYLPAKLP
jgi:hypothetical protein